MARKLSEFTRGALHVSVMVVAPLAAEKALAEDRPRESAAPVIVENPFSSGGPQPATVVKQSPPQPRGEIIYRNPFAAGSATPPIATPLLPGPTSRWHRSVLLFDEPSAVKTAILSADPIQNTHIPWDEIPPAETLRDRAVNAATRSDVPPAAEFAVPPDPVQFAATPLAQPTWLMVDPRPVATSPVGQASFDQSIVGEPSVAWASGPVQAARPQADFPPIVISDIDDTPEDLLSQAQQAAGGAQSLGDLSAVANMCERGLAAGPGAELSDALRRLAAWAHNRRGELLADADRQQEALEAFQLAISLDANCSLAIHNRAVTLAEQNQLPAALRDFNRVIELNPGLAVAYRNRAELLAGLGRMNEAVADYSRAIESLSDDAELYAARGYAWQRLGDFDRASADLNRAMEIAPDRADLLTQRGNLAAERGDYDRALADFRQAMAIDPNRAEAYRSLAWLHATSSDARYRDAQQALSAARKAAELSAAGDYLVLEALAAANAAAGKFDDAVRIQQQAIADTPREFVEPVRQRLALYQARQPFRSGPPAPRPSPALRSR